MSRLLLAAVLAYWWLTYLGLKGREADWDKLVHRGDHRGGYMACPPSYFQVTSP